MYSSYLLFVYVIVWLAVVLGINMASNTGGKTVIVWDAAKYFYNFPACIMNLCVNNYIGCSILAVTLYGCHKVVQFVQSVCNLACRVIKTLHDGCAMGLTNCNTQICMGITNFWSIEAM